MDKLLCDIEQYDIVSIIGLEKNVGKTTTLNYLIGKSKGLIFLGLTSIGRDGEDEDIVTSTHKPNIFVFSGTLVATAKSCMLESDVTAEILETTGINTPIGEVIIFRALTDGHIHLAGPSINSQIEYISNRLLSYGATKVFVDGALSRKSMASPAITDATILCTGASFSRDVDKVVDTTKHYVELLSLEQCENEKARKLAKELVIDNSVSIINKDLSFKTLDIKTALNNANNIIDSIDENSEYVVFKGVILDNILQAFMKNSELLKKVKFLVCDGTKVFVSHETYYKFLKLGGSIYVLSKINLAYICANPTSPTGFNFDKDTFLSKLRNNLSLPVYDIHDLEKNKA